MPPKAEAKGTVINKQLDYGQLNPGDRFVWPVQGGGGVPQRTYVKRTGDRRNGGEAECLDDPALSQTFFDTVPVQAEVFVPAD